MFELECWGEFGKKLEMILFTVGMKGIYGKKTFTQRQPVKFLRKRVSVRESG